ncbi:hypothetical protein ACWEQA_26050 [Nocardia sp. NPDC004085]
MSKQLSPALPDTDFVVAAKASSCAKPNDLIYSPQVVQGTDSQP